MLLTPNAIWKGIEWRLHQFARNAYYQCLYRLAFLRRRLLSKTTFIGITGSAGKTTAKDLVAAILERHSPQVRKSKGTFNFPFRIARLVIDTRASDDYCIAEIAITPHGGIDLPVALFRPMVGVVTNIGGDHFSVYGSLDGIAEEKSKLIKSLPPNGIAVLNVDDPRVLAMQSQFSGRTVTYGMGDGAMLKGESVSSSWPDRLSFTVRWNGESARVHTQLCGSHWVPVVLAALATGVALGVPLIVAAQAVGGVEPFEARMSPVKLGNGVTFIRDDWKAPLWTIAPTLEFMRQARATRKIIVIGTISDCPGDSSRRYAQIARQALAVADCVLFVGPQASASLRAKRTPKDMLFAFPSLGNASNYLSGYLRSGDLVLLKGSTRTDHLERLLLVHTAGVACWRSACGLVNFCNECSLLHVASEPEATEATKTTLEAIESSIPGIEPSPLDESMVVVVGLGNPGERYVGTRHNVGYCVVDMLAHRFDAAWIREGDLAMVVRTSWEGTPIYLVKLLTLMNEVGPPLLRLAQELGFSVANCILVHDDLDLPVGTVRMRSRGGDGGHRGMRSILQSFQNDKFRRVKIGIGKPISGQSIVDYVLTPFSAEQIAAVDAANISAMDQVIELIRQTSSTKSPLVESA